MNQPDQNQNSSIQTEKRSASMAPVENGAGKIPGDDPEIDDLGTNQSETARILTTIRDGAFDSSNEKLALALGRPTAEIEEWTREAGTIDGDVVQKARALAIARGLEID